MNQAAVLFFMWLVLAQGFPLRCIMYLTGQHPEIPKNYDLKNDITHVILAFMNSGVFNLEDDHTEFPLFTTVEETRQQLHSNTKVMVAIGGWGDSRGFEKACEDEISRRKWCHNVKKMVEITGADGVDIDWEYPGGNRDDYKLIPNEKREWEIEAFAHLLGDLREALGREKILSIAVPGLERDLMAFTTATIPRIVEQVDFVNVMTYDLLNRRDTVIKHHTGVAASLASIQAYISRGAPPEMLNLGLAYYVKWAMTEDCDPSRLLECRTKLLEDPETGADLGKTAAFSWHDEVPHELEPSFARAILEGKYFADGSFGYWDKNEKLWWTLDTERVIEHKFQDIVRTAKLGGVFAWGLGEDAPRFSHLSATLRSLRGLKRDNSREEL